MKTFRTRYYHIKNKKLAGVPWKFAFLSDLHGLSFGNQNEKLLLAIQNEKPDAILLAGDMTNRYLEETYEVAEKLLLSLSKEFPVYYALGNHEYKEFEEKTPLYIEYEKRLTASGVRFLHNDKVLLQKKQSSVCLHGLELSLEYFKKPFPPALSKAVLQALLGEPEEEVFHILLAHNPKFGTVYRNWGADLVLSGHYHGGLVRFSENIGLVSTFGHPFPAYCCGKFAYGEQTMLVSPGLGEHSVPIRIWNPRELLIVTCE